MAMVYARHKAYYLSKIAIKSDASKVPLRAQFLLVRVQVDYRVIVLSHVLQRYIDVVVLKSKT